jgi:hypothetical protein
MVFSFIEGRLVSIFDDEGLSGRGQISRWLAMANVIADKKYRQGIVDKVHTNECLCCKKKAARRGLCQSCYRFFVIALTKLPVARRTAFEERMIREGKILGVSQVKEIRYGDANTFRSTVWPKPTQQSA